MRKVCGPQRDRRVGWWFYAAPSPWIFALCLFLLVAPVPVVAQGADCATLRADIEASGSAEVSPGQWSNAARQQDYQIQRTRAYFDSIGCNNDADFAGGDQAQCQAIAARIQRMEENLDRLQAQTQNNARAERRRAMIEDYNSQCSAPPAAPDVDDTEAEPKTMPIDPDRPSIMDSPPSDAEPQAPESKVLCVRQCDGGFFPIAYKATPDQLGGLAQLCKALCPNAEVQLFTTRPGQDIEQAVSTDGTPYASLPAAFKYQKTFDPTCTCKPPNQSWVQALAAAEAMIDHDKNDVIVTPEISAQMAKPVPKPDPEPVVPKPASPKPVKATKTARKAKAPIVGQAPPPPAYEGNAGLAPPDPAEGIMRQIRPTAPLL